MYITKERMVLSSKELLTYIHHHWSASATEYCILLDTHKHTLTHTITFLYLAMGLFYICLARLCELSTYLPACLPTCLPTYLSISLPIEPYHIGAGRGHSFDCQRCVRKRAKSVCFLHVWLTGRLWAVNHLPRYSNYVCLGAYLFTSVIIVNVYNCKGAIHFFERIDAIASELFTTPCVCV
ncbi:hypothetical protein F4777DRAFT_353943 [Nemania sp. FL0916]|nr:hypothetical protein F4777DRAFT_353943 [Nemania sp. FL0916]